MKNEGEENELREEPEPSVPVEVISVDLPFALITRPPIIRREKNRPGVALSKLGDEPGPYLRRIKNPAIYRPPSEVSTSASYIVLRAARNPRNGARIRRGTVGLRFLDMRAGLVWFSPSSTNIWRRLRTRGEEGGACRMMYSFCYLQKEPCRSEPDSI